jgi:hypothetical protein
VLDREPLRDRAAERHAHQVAAVQLQLVHQLRDVGGEVREVRRRLARPADGAADVAVVQEDQRKVAGEVRDDGVPQATSRPETRDEQQRLALSDDLVIQPDV